jgi:hypothetical protein
MDVIVDTCILFSDPFMLSNTFKDLFQYLRTTDSRLVILPIVFDEIIAKHEEELTKRHRTACAAARSLNERTLRSLAPRVGDLNLEIGILSGVLKSGVREGEPLPLKLLSDYSNIDVKEVATRGIKRMAPSNSKGEELRDVMVWLASLSYCRESKKAVAFITEDMDFWAQGKKAIKPELDDELTRNQIKLQVYQNLTEFLKAIATNSTDISKNWFERHVSMVRITEILERYRETLVYGVWHGERSVKLLSSTIEFRSGKLYDLGGGAQLGKIEFACQIALRVEDWPYPPPEAYYPEERAREMRLLQQPIHTEDYQLNPSLFISLRLQDDDVTDLIPERFDYDSPVGTGVVTPPVFLRQSYS